MFIFKVSISKYYVIISLILSIIITLFLSKRENLLSEKNKLYGIIATILPILIIFSSFYFNGKVIDTSYDGNAYQKAAIGLLKNGWNPVYETSEEFDENAHC